MWGYWIVLAMNALTQYDSSGSSDLCEDDDVNINDEQPGVDRNVCEDDKSVTGSATFSGSIRKAESPEGEELLFVSSNQLSTNATHQNECQKVDYFGLETVNEDGTDPVPSYTDTVYKRGTLAEATGSLSTCVSANGDDGQTLVSVPDTPFWKGETSVESIEDSLEMSTATYNPVHAIHQQTNPRRSSADFVDRSNRQQEDNYGYIRKKRRTEFEQSQSTPESGCTKLPQRCYTIHHKVAPHLNQKHVNRAPRRKLKDISSHSGIVNKIEWCRPEFSHLLLSAGMDRSVKVWDVLSSTPACVQTLRFHEKAVKNATWSAQGREILSGGYDRTARICDVEKGVTTSCCSHKDFVTSVKWHPVNHHLFVTGSRNVIKCWDKRNTSRPAKTFTYKEGFGQVQDIEFLRDGSEFLSCTDMVARDSADKSIMAWHFDSGVVLSNQIYQERYTCTRLRVHPSEARFVAQTQGGYIALFSTIKPYKMNKCKRFDAHQVLGHSVGCDFSPDGRILASGSSDGSLVCYDFHLAKSIVSLAQPGSVCLDVAWHPVLFSTVASTSTDGTISIWQ